jgi:ABC-type transport system involved in multi-copper enzyme maturation permease subunit
MEALLLGQTTTVIVVLLLLLSLLFLREFCAWLRTASFGIFDMLLMLWLYLLLLSSFRPANAIVIMVHGFWFVVVNVLDLCGAVAVCCVLTYFHLIVTLEKRF